MNTASDNRAYMLASVADRVFLHPSGELDIIGLSIEQQYLRETMDLVGIQAQYARRAEYKSGPEPMTRTEGSAPAREQLDALLDDISRQWIQAIAEGRGKTAEQVQALVDSAPLTGKEAVESGLVDGLVYPSDLQERLEEIFPKNFDRDRNYGFTDLHRGWRTSQEIAVVYVDGGIVSGESSGPGFFGGGRTAGAETIARQIDAAAEDSSVKALVLRVDSPGGSAFASDDIWQAVERLKEDGKPVVVSMGGVAASGGYYVAAGADAIYASPSTITGSIGVYGGKFNAAELFDKLGVNTEIYSRGRNASMWSTARPMDESEFATLDHLIDDTYGQFKSKVEAGRRMSAERVEEVARGRVWSGAAAKEQGLVDELGGFHAAVQRARQEAEIPDRAEVRLVTYGTSADADGDVPRRAVRVQGVGFPGGASAGVAAALPRRAAALPRLAVAAAARRVGLGENEPLVLPRELQSLETWRRLSDERVLALMPYTLEIR